MSAIETVETLREVIATVERDNAQLRQQLDSLRKEVLAHRDTVHSLQEENRKAERERDEARAAGDAMRQCLGSMISYLVDLKVRHPHETHEMTNVLIEEGRRVGQGNPGQPLLDERDRLRKRCDKLEAALQQISENPFLDPEANATFADKALAACREDK